MKFDDLVRRTSDLPLIDTATLRALGSAGKGLGVQLSRWVRSGRLIQLRKGAYLLPEHLQRAHAPAEQLANLLVRPSYVSLERALSIHGLIPEAVPNVQSVTTGRPTQIDTLAGSFTYRHVKRTWFFGYREMSVGGGTALVASGEKALLDLVYFSPGEFTIERVAGLRLQDLGRIDIDELVRIARVAESPRVTRAARVLTDFIGAEREETVEL
jgi:predicted transcriptional regulator of viral defense system